jgi:hypothetical protein
MRRLRAPSCSKLKLAFSSFGSFIGSGRLELLERECQLIIVETLGLATEMCSADLRYQVFELGSVKMNPLVIDADQITFPKFVVSSLMVASSSVG